MNKLICVIIAVALAGFCFATSLSTNSQTTFVGGVAKRTIVGALGAGHTVNLTGTSSSTLNLTTTGFGALDGVVNLNHVSFAVSTVNVIVGGSVGDFVVLQTTRASEDVVVLDTTGINLNANRTLTDPADKLILFKRSATNWDEFGFYDNN